MFGTINSLGIPSSASQFQHSFNMLPSLLLALAGTPLLARAAASVIALENTAQIPTGWRLKEPAKDSDVLTLFVALKQPRLTELKTQLSQSNSLRHREVAGHTSQKQLKEYRRTNATSVPSVLKWLDSHGVEDRRTYDGWVSFNLTAQAAKTILGADLSWFSYGTSAPVLRTQQYTVPSWLKQHIDFIHPLLHFMPPRTNRQTRKQSGKPPPPQPTTSPELPCSGSTFPECIRKLYNITTNTTHPSPSRLGIGGFLEQYINYADVGNFLDVYAPELTNLTPPYNFTVSLLNNGANSQDLWTAGREASLDVEYALSLGYPANITYYSTGGRGVKLVGADEAIPTTGSDNEPYLEFLQGLLALPDSDLPHVLSISYADDEQTVPRAYAERVCDLFAELAARGVSTLAASGDGGAAGIGQNLCLSNDGARRKTLLPTFPASCPWVTAVGATQNEGPPVIGAEFSSGGFSDYFARPVWQDGVVVPYIQKLNGSGDEKVGLFNASGRAIPDVSAVGSGFLIEYGGSAAAVQGTSASTPVLAAMFALVNDQRLRAGKPSLGWLNPLLYGDEVRGVLEDITAGASYQCMFGDQGDPVDGWEAVEGYDCVTGLGVPGDFGRLLEVLG